MAAAHAEFLINSISRFMHLISSHSLKDVPGQKDYGGLMSALKRFKGLLDEATLYDVPSSEDDDKFSTFIKECSDLDAAVNETREFLESWFPQMSKLRCAMEFEQRVFKIKTLALEICNLLGISRPHSSSPALSNLKQCVDELKCLVCEGSGLVSDALKMMRMGTTPDRNRLHEIAASLSLNSSIEILNERISLERALVTVRLGRVDGEQDGLIETVALLTRIGRQAAGSIPLFFCCPLSLELMVDPVIVSSGQTYDRGSIQRWLDSGLVCCPNTGLPLKHTTLIPNHAVRALISSWCDDSRDIIESEDSSGPGVRIPGLCHSRGDSLTSVDSSYSGFSAESKESRDPSGDDEMVTASFADRLVNDLTSPSLATRAAAAADVRRLTRRNDPNRTAFFRAGVLPPVLALMRSSDAAVQEQAATALLNLSLNERCKREAAESGAVSLISHVLRSGTGPARENSAAALYSLSQLDDWRREIGRSEAVAALVGLLASGSDRGKKDAMMALYNLSICHENKSHVVQAGAVTWLLPLLDLACGLADRAVALLANLTSVPEGQSAVVRDGGIPLLVEVVEVASDKAKENAAAALFHICFGSPKYCTAVLHEGVVAPLVSLSFTGTPRAKEKAQQLLNHFRRHREAGEGIKG